MDKIVRPIACKPVLSRAKTTTLSLTCCHKGFEDPVLDALWETQVKLLPLLKSLPVDVWNEGECTVSVPITHISIPQLFGLKSLSKDSR